jgi:hypothetical protein
MLRADGLVVLNIIAHVEDTAIGCKVEYEKEIIVQYASRDDNPFEPLVGNRTRDRVAKRGLRDVRRIHIKLTSTSRTEQAQRRGKASPIDGRRALPRSFLKP